MHGDYISLALPMQRFKDQRVDIRVQRMHKAWCDAVREFGGINMRITPCELAVLATVGAAMSCRDAGAEDLDAMLARGDTVDCPANRVPLHLGAASTTDTLPSETAVPDARPRRAAVVRGRPASRRRVPAGVAHVSEEPRQGPD